MHRIGAACRRALAVMLPVCVLALGAAAPAAAAPAGCPGQEVPPPPAAVEESAAAAPAALAVPAEPLGGPLLGGCAEVSPPGTPALPRIGAASWVLADLDSGTVLAARAPHARHRPASALKVLTALVALDRLEPETIVDGTAEDLRIDGSKAGIGPGGRYPVRVLLAALLLNSGNDAANALARQLGGPATTIAAMTERADALGAMDTRPATVSGLDGSGMASSAYDLALMFRAGLRDPIFAATVATRLVRFPGYGDKPGFTLSNTDRLLAGYPGALGGKSGFTDAARHTYVGAAQRGGRRLVVALVRGEQTPLPMWKQAAALLDYGFALPAGTAGVGTLVDGPPQVPATPATPAATPPADRRSPTPPRWLLVTAAAAATAVTAALGARAALGGRAVRRRR